MRPTQTWEVLPGLFVEGPEGNKTPDLVDIFNSSELELESSENDSVEE